MRLSAKSLLVRFGEPWLALNRLLTVQALKRRLRHRNRRGFYEPDPQSMLYVAASALPYHTSGYTTRTHELIRALGDAGAHVHAMTRPGYPWDRKDRQLDADADAGQTVFGGVRYWHSPWPLNNRPVLQYVLQAASAVADMAVRSRAAVIHAASNHVNALPALLAARRLGIPFQYEMRGLWEVTRMSRFPCYEGSQAYEQGLQLEGLVASHADRLFVISAQLGKFVSERCGVRRMAILPNCVDPERFAVTPPRDAQPYTIGYAGTLIGYEGLDTLIDAVDVLVRRGSHVKAILIGDGEARSQLEAQAHRLGLKDRIRFAGRVSPDAVRQRLARCAVVCIPRKPFKVCEMVPPIKLVEALAMGKPVIVPDLPVFRDEMGSLPAGWFFKAGDASDLARVISAALADADALAVLGERARIYAATQRNWRSFAANAVPMAQNRGCE